MWEAETSCCLALGGFASSWTTINLLLLLTLEVISLNLWDCIPLVKNPLESPTLTSTYISSTELVTALLSGGEAGKSFNWVVWP